jgi:hypothetical protein
MPTQLFSNYTVVCIATTSFLARMTTCCGVPSVITLASISKKNLTKLVGLFCLFSILHQRRKRFTNHADIHLNDCALLRCSQQVFWYLPLKAQLANLLQNKHYRYLLMHEWRRAKTSNSANYLSDVYDTSRWRKVAGEPTERLTRIVYQLCVDAFPWSSRKMGVGTYHCTIPLPVT